MKKWRWKNKEMTMTEQKLQKLTYDAQNQTGWYLCRLAGLPTMTSHGEFDRVVRKYGYRCALCNTINPSLSIDHIIPNSRGGQVGVWPHIPFTIESVV
jgi:5-methylcytosine-specific restriction endonuclease McrA